MKGIERVFKTRNGPGVVVRGKINASLEEVFTDLRQEVSDFYLEQDLVIATSLFDSRRKRYEFPIYDPYKVEVEMIHHRDPDDPRSIISIETKFSSAPALGDVSLIPQQVQVKRRYVEDWDFAHTPHETRIEQILAYFNLNSMERISARGYSISQRDEFYNFMIRNLGSQ